MWCSSAAGYRQANKAAEGAQKAVLAETATSAGDAAILAGGYAIRQKPPTGRSLLPTAAIKMAQVLKLEPNNQNAEKI
jgi:hypothetical protein